MATGAVPNIAPHVPTLRDLKPTAHDVQFYESDSFLIDAAAPAIGASLRAGDSAIVIAADSHRTVLEGRLRADGIDLDSAGRQRRYLAPDLTATLASFMVRGMPDEAAFLDSIGAMLQTAEAAAEHRHVQVLGEMVAVLWAEGNQSAAIALEHLWNLLARRIGFSLHCAYPLNALTTDVSGSAFLELCSAHSRVIPAEGFTDAMSPDQRARSIAYLQQRAKLLEVELARRARLEQELREKLEQLAQTDRRKDEFLAMLGHELRNPLSAIVNGIEIAACDHSRRERALRIAARQSHQLARLVNDLLDVARITHGRIALRKQPLRVGEVLESALEEVRPRLESCLQRCTRALDAETENARIDADPARMQQVIGNLLNNASKFSPSGGSIELRAKCSGDQLQISVRDWGAGIEPHFLPRVFDLFAQGGASAPCNGLGIGLTVARRLVELHGGQISAHSSGPGQGSEFVIRMPLLNGARQDWQQAGTAPASARPSSVLIVEDNTDCAESLAMVLELLGHRTHSVGDGKAALDVVRAGRFDAAIIDIGLPGMDGYEVVRQIRALRGGVAMRLAALSGYGQAGDRRRALAAGFDCHLTKPVELEELQRFFAESSVEPRKNGAAPGPR